METGRALHRATVAFVNRHAVGTIEPRRGLAAVLSRWGTGVVAIGFGAIAIMLFLRPEGNLAAADPRALLPQMEALFPGQLRAVVDRGDQVGIELSDQPGPVSDQPLAVTLHKNGKTIGVLSYSGNKVCVVLADREVCFEPLATDAGDVILSGVDFVWTDRAPVRVGG